MSDPILRFFVMNSVAAAGLCGVALVCSWARVRPSVVAVCWLVALVKLVLPPVVPVPVLQAFSRAGDSIGSWVAPHRVLAPSVLVLPFGQGGGGPADVIEPDVLPAVAQPLSSRAEGLPDFHLRTGVLIFWIVGAGLWAGLTLFRMTRFHVLVCRGERLADGRPETVAVEAAVPPLLWAFGGRARIVVPRALWGGLSEGERAAVLAHERAHFRRRDHWVRWVEWVVLCVCWWHPLAWWISRRLHEAEEAACDRLVVHQTGEPRVYAAALIRAALFLDACGRLPQTATGIGSVSSLKQRIDTLMKPADFRPLTVGGAIVLLSALTFSVLADPLAVPSKTSAGDPPSAAEVPAPLRTEAEPPMAEPSEQPTEAVDPPAPAKPDPETDRDIGQLYLSGYIKLTEADKLQRAGDPAGARRLYTEALSIFESVHSQAPEWQSSMVEFRINHVRRKVAEVAAAAGFPAETTIHTPLSSTPQGLKRVGLKTSILGQPLAVAADRIDMIQPGTVPGRASQVTFRNGQSTYASAVDSPKPGGSLIITGSIRAHWGGWNILADNAVLQEAQSLSLTGGPLVVVEASSETPKWILKAGRITIDLKTRRLKVSGGEELLFDPMLFSDPRASMEFDFSLEGLPKPFPRGKMGRRQEINLSEVRMARERERLLIGWPSRAEWAAEMDVLMPPRVSQ